jgi:hypothetical protein
MSERASGHGGGETIDEFGSKIGLALQRERCGGNHRPKVKPLSFFFVRQSD